MTMADPHLDTGAYALDAMPEDEAVVTRAHLEDCGSCSAELAGFLETAALLGAAAAEMPPASLRRTVMALVSRTPQLPPLIARPSNVVREADVAAEPAVRSDRSNVKNAGPDTPSPERFTTDRSNLDSTVVLLRPWYRRPRNLLVAAAAAAVVGGGTVVAVNQIGQPQVTQSAEQCVGQAPDRQLITPAKGAGTVSFAASCSAALLDVTGLPTLPANQTYQLWAIAGDKPRSLGVLPEVSKGQQKVITATPQAGESVVAITAEPAGGSLQPTLPILWQASLAS